MSLLERSVGSHDSNICAAYLFHSVRFYMGGTTLKMNHTERQHQGTITITLLLSMNMVQSDSRTPFGNLLYHFLFKIIE